MSEEPEKYYFHKELRQDLKELRQNLSEVQTLFIKHNNLKEDLTEFKSSVRELKQIVQDLTLQQSENTRKQSEIIENMDRMSKITSELESRLTKLEQGQETRNTVSQGIKDWGGWIVAVLSLIILLLEKFNLIM